MRLYWIIVVSCFVLALIGGCSTPTVDVQTVCLPLKTYTLKQQQQLAAELRALPPGDVLGVVITDYERMRDADRACIANH